MNNLIGFNINHYVYVKITDYGMEILKKNHYKLYEHSDLIRAWRPPEVDENGFTKFQLHQLMAEFGDYCFATNRIPFETEIFFEAPTNG